MNTIKKSSDSRNITSEDSIEAAIKKSKLESYLKNRAHSTSDIAKRNLPDEEEW